MQNIQEQINDIEQLAGRITELLGGYPSKDNLEFKALPLLNEFKDQMGKFLRYRELNQAMRNFIHTAATVFLDIRDGDDPRPDIENLDNAFNQLVISCNKVSKKENRDKKIGFWWIIKRLAVVIGLVYGLLQLLSYFKLIP